MSSVRVVARVRPLLKSELERDTIITTSSSDSEASNKANIVRIPNPKNAGEDFSFQFNSVYDQEATQQDIFENEVSPTIKHLFAGFDVTLFAYGVTGTGKTHTMRGGKTIAERGVIPRLLSGIYRRSRKIEKDSQGETKVEVAMSYYEIYNDRVFDLFEAPEKRTLTGLQLRDNGGKTVVVGLTERPCESLKEFERLYDQANVNRSTSATKLNAHSSRSHAVLCVKLTITTGDEIRMSTASAIDLAGSEDNRRTDNGKERLVESASINKSLFVLAQCVEAISKKQARIPYRESKMTRILSIGQNNGLTVMILNLAPVRSYHLDTLSSLNFANRTKKIEIREIENEPIIKGCSRAVPTFTGSTIQRQPLRPLTSTAHNATTHPVNTASKPSDKPSKAFSVYSDKSKPRLSNPALVRRTEAPKRSSPFKRPSDSFGPSVTRPPKYAKTSPESFRKPQPTISKAAIEDIIEKKVTEILAARALDQPSIAPVPEISEEVQRRLEMLEQKIDGKDDGRAEGLTFLLMAKQHHVRGEDSSALKMYELAKEYFPDNPKLDGKFTRLREKLKDKRIETEQHARTQLISMRSSEPLATAAPAVVQKTRKDPNDDNDDDDYHDAPEPVPVPNADAYSSDASFRFKSKSKSKSRPKHPTQLPPTVAKAAIDISRHPPSRADVPPTPRTEQLLRIVNTRDVSRIRLLKGVGAKKAGVIVEAVRAAGEEGGVVVVGSLWELGQLAGVGERGVERMRLGLG